MGKTARKFQRKAQNTFDPIVELMKDGSIRIKFSANGRKLTFSRSKAQNFIDHIQRLLSYPDYAQIETFPQSSFSPRKPKSKSTVKRTAGKEKEQKNKKKRNRRKSAFMRAGKTNTFVHAQSFATKRKGNRRKKATNKLINSAKPFKTKTILRKKNSASF